MSRRGPSLHKMQSVRAAVVRDGVVRIRISALNALLPEAVARGMTVHALARLLIEQIAEDNLVGAVLDD